MPIRSYGLVDSVYIGHVYVYLLYDAASADEKNNVGIYTWIRR